MRLTSTRARPAAGSSTRLGGYEGAGVVMRFGDGVGEGSGVSGVVRGGWLWWGIHAEKRL